MVYGSYRSRNDPIEQIMVTCISFSKTALQPGQHDPYDPYGSRNNASRVVQLVNCIDIYIVIPMINNSVELIRPVIGSRNKHAKDNACPKAQNTMNIPRSQSVRTEQRYTYAVLFGVLLFKAQNTVNILRSQSMRTQQRCIFPRAQNIVNMLRSQSVISSESSRALHTVAGRFANESFH